MNRSNAYALAAQGAEAEEILESAPQSIRDDLALALAGVRRELLTVFDSDDSDAAAFASAIALFIALVGGGWSIDQRSDFCRAAEHDLAGLPALHVIPAIDEARRSISLAREFVPWVHARVRELVAALEREHAILTRLDAAISGTTGQAG